MTKRKKVFLIILIVVALLLLCWLVWFLTSKKGVENQSVPNLVPVKEVVEPRGGKPENPEPLVIETNLTEVSLESLAMTFTERYGSYSTESDFANLDDVLSLMTDSFKAKTEAYLASAKNSKEYYGLTTRVLSVKTIALDETGGTASMEVYTQQEESQGSPRNSSLRYKKIILNLVKEQSVWKIDSANWQ